MSWVMGKLKALFGPSVIAGQVRHLMTLLGGLLMGYGATQTQVNSLTDVIVGLVPVIIAMVGSKVSKQ